jgi:hypothetical protein
MTEILKRQHLRADCNACAALCCVAPQFEVSADFPIRKPAGTACPHLAGDDRCRIHDHLREEGFSGCAAFDCFGAGQRTTQLFGGRTWRTDRTVAPPMFGVFAALRLLHEILWYLDEAIERLSGGTLRDEVRELQAQTHAMAAAPPEMLTSLNVSGHQERAGVVLDRVSQALRADLGPGISLRGADLAGRHYAGADLRGADLRGAWLIRADFRGADLRRADLLGADLRGADLRGTNLSDAIFLTRAQVQAAIGDSHTSLPSILSRPPHWSARGP